VSLNVRPAELRDLDDLVQLRLENGRVHAVLDPSVYRVPDSKAVREHFNARLMADDDDHVPGVRGGGARQRSRLRCRCTFASINSRR